MDLAERIAKVNEDEIQIAVRAIMRRWEELFPDWEINIVCIDKSADRNEQIDRDIALLESLRRCHYTDLTFLE